MSFNDGANKKGILSNLTLPQKHLPKNTILQLPIQETTPP